MIRVAIDGPAGVGKSSTSKALAKYYGFAYLDTGAMYRACAWWCMHKGIDLDAETIDEQLVTETVGEFFTDSHFDISVDPDDPKVYADDEDISEAIRSSEVSSHVSKVSNIIPVRHVLIAAQRAYIAREASVDSFSEGAGIVAEGRDITTVVAPDAEVRILLTAREEVRQARRSGQAVSGVGAENVAARDKADSKVTNFTSAAEGVLTVDNSDLNFGETLDVLVRIVDDAIEEQEYRQYVSNLEGYELDEGDEELIDGTAFSGGESKNGPKPVGVLAVVGRPNVGKSTLINALIGTQIAIASSRPETTRKAIRGILTTDNAQIVLVDTPGIHRPRTLLGQRLNDVVDESLSDVDAIAFLLPADQEIGPGDKRILSRLRSDFAVKRDDGTFKWKVPLIAIVTKIDELDRSALIDKLIEINEFADFTDIVPVSALEHDNLAEVRNVLVENMPEGPQMYPAEQITEERPEDTIAELIRGAFLEELDDELPHSLAVVVDSIEYPEDNDSGESYAGKAQVIVSIYVERDSQKPIIIGHNAEHLVRVKKKLRTAVNRIVGQKAKLDLHVKVAKGWQSDPKQLEKLGF